MLSVDQPLAEVTPANPQVSHTLGQLDQLPVNDPNATTDVFDASVPVNPPLVADINAQTEDPATSVTKKDAQKLDDE